jgi:hypothetical protein
VTTFTVLPFCVDTWNEPVIFSVTDFDGSERFVNVAFVPGEVKISRPPGRLITPAFPANENSTSKAHSPVPKEFAGRVWLPETGVGGEP